MILAGMSNFRLFPESASSVSSQVDALFWFVTSIAAGITLLIACLILYFIVRYRRRDPDERPAATITHNWMEITWTAVPLAITMAIFVWGTVVYVRIFRPPPDAMEIHVIAKQWMWKIQHSNGRREINELHIPVGRTIKLVLTSQDVIHDFFVPAFRVKHDVLPNRYVTEWFKATKPGEYHFFCAQYCGAQHAKMRGRVVAMEPQDYQAWLASGNGVQPDQPPEVVGRQLFIQYSCVTCHGEQAPTLAGVYGSQVHLADGRTVKADDNYLRESMLDPAAKIVSGYTPIMPSFKGVLSEDQIFNLIAYIKSLRDAKSMQPGPVVMPGQTQTPPASPQPQPQEPGQ